LALISKKLPPKLPYFDLDIYKADSTDSESQVLLPSI